MEELRFGLADRIGVIQESGPAGSQSFNIPPPQGSGGLNAGFGD